MSSSRREYANAAAVPATASTAKTARPQRGPNSEHRQYPMMPSTREAHRHTTNAPRSKPMAKSSASSPATPTA